MFIFYFIVLMTSCYRFLYVFILTCFASVKSELTFGCKIRLSLNSGGFKAVRSVQLSADLKLLNPVRTNTFSPPPSCGEVEEEEEEEEEEGSQI